MFYGHTGSPLQRWGNCPLTLLKKKKKKCIPVEPPIQKEELLDILNEDYNMQHYHCSGLSHLIMLGVPNFWSEHHSSGSCTLYEGCLINNINNNINNNNINRKAKNPPLKPEENKQFNFLINLPYTGCKVWKYFEHFLCFLMKCFSSVRWML